MMLIVQRTQISYPREKKRNPPYPREKTEILHMFEKKPKASCNINET